MRIKFKKAPACIVYDVWFELSAILGKTGG
jgi:hypothetical protein